MKPEAPGLSSICGMVAPCFVPSVSGAAKTNLSLIAHVRALVDWQAASLLVSAYDIHHLSKTDQRVVFEYLERALDQQAVVFLDSGGYEARWLRDPRWSIEDYHHVLLGTPHSVAFTYDLDDVPPAVSLDATAQHLGTASGLIPIVHGTGTETEETVADLSGQAVAGVAVSERDLGPGLDQVATALRRIAVATGSTTPIHVLGAGNPLSILVYVEAGATSFDGLEWCQTVADPKTGTMHHSKHLPLFMEGYSSEDGDYSLRLLGHNLVFFDNWMRAAREALAGGTIASLVDTCIPNMPR